VERRGSIESSACRKHLTGGGLSIMGVVPIHLCEIYGLRVVFQLHKELRMIRYEQGGNDKKSKRRDFGEGCP